MCDKSVSGTKGGNSAKQLRRKAVHLFTWLRVKMASIKSKNKAKKDAIDDLLASMASSSPSAKRIMWVTLQEEESRYIVGVYYGDYRPPNYRFYVADKITHQVQVLEDDAAYSPKPWY